MVTVTLSEPHRMALAAMMVPFPAPADLTPADLARATDSLRTIQEIRRALETARAEQLTPLRARLDEIRGAYDQVLSRAADVEATLKAVILGHRQYLARQHAEAAQRAADAQAALAAAEAQADARAAGLPDTEAHVIAESVRTAVAHRERAAIAPAPVPRTTQGDTGRATVVTTWTYEIVDAARVPREYLTVDTVAVGKAVRAGARDIPGVHIYARESVSGRR